MTSDVAFVIYFHKEMCDILVDPEDHDQLLADVQADLDLCWAHNYSLDEAPLLI